MMIKKIVLAVALVACVAGSSFAGTISWGYIADLGGVYSDGWLVELIEDVNQDGISIGGGLGSGMIMYSDGSGNRDHLDGDDTWVGGITTTLSSGKSGIFWTDSFGSPAGVLALGDDVYTVIYNAATFGDATQYMVVDASPYTLPATDVDGTYAQTTVNGTWAPIVPVPEPGTIMLFALGLVTLVARRKRG